MLFFSSRCLCKLKAWFENVLFLVWNALGGALTIFRTSDAKTNQTATRCPKPFFKNCFSSRQNVSLFTQKCTWPAMLLRPSWRQRLLRLHDDVDKWRRRPLKTSRRRQKWRQATFRRFCRQVSKILIPEHDDLREDARRSVDPAATASKQQRQKTVQRFYLWGPSSWLPTNQWSNFWGQAGPTKFLQHSQSHGTN